MYALSTEVTALPEFTNVIVVLRMILKMIAIAITAQTIFALFVFSLFFSFAVFAQNRVGFFSAVSSSDDESTINLTEDLYFSKASLLSEVNIIDHRNKNFSYSELSLYNDLNYAFFPEIQEDGDGWLCTFHAINLKTKKEYNSQKHYDSYYKILMDAKNELESFFISMKSSDSLQKNSQGGNVQLASTINLDMLSGTWKGEPYIDKIVILRGGRGFVIFKNGASMNISVVVANGKLTATQLGSSNVSYYPDVEQSLVLALNEKTQPIVWNFEIKSASILEGTKNTLQENGQSAVFTTIPVTWTKL